MRNAFRSASVALAVALLPGCATQSAGPYQTAEISSSDAIVLLGVDSEIPLAQISVPCHGILSCPHSLGVRKDVMAFPAAVGTQFKIEQIRTMDQRAARLNTRPLAIEKRGIYYYGTIVSTASRAGLRYEADRRMLLGAKRKFGARYDGYAAINFSWPDPAEDRALGLRYLSSASTPEALRSATNRRLRLVTVAPPKDFDPSCRLGSSAISLPDFLPYEEYVRRAFNVELEAAGLLDESESAMALTGALTELAFSTTAPSAWKIALRVGTHDGRSAKASTTVPFEASFASAARACAAAEDTFPEAVRQLLETLAKSSDFRTMLSETAQ